MVNNGVPRLCGGTFFTQLLLSRKPTVSQRQRTQGETDVFHNEDVLFALLQIIQPDAVKPTGNSFETYTTNFKKCGGSIGEDLKFENEYVMSAFNKRMSDDYPAVLRAMTVFCAEYIDTRETTQEHQNLVKRLIELIRDDVTVTDEVMFRVDDNGTKLNRKALVKITEASLPDFLLAVWAFAVTRRNGVGQATIVAWTRNPNNVKGRYNGIDGSSIKQEIKVDCGVVCEESGNGQSTETDEPSARQSEPQSDTATASQVVNNGFLFQQFGENNKQIIGNVGTLIINND